MRERGEAIGFVRLSSLSSLSSSSSLSVINFFEKNLRTGDLEAIMISKQKVNAEIRDTLACLYLI